MRKILYTLLFILPLSTVNAQPTYSDLDTVNHLPEYYHTPSWYTDCFSFKNDTSFFFKQGMALYNNLGYLPGRVSVREFHTDHSVEVYGMVALVEINPALPNTLINPNAGRAPEFLKLLQGTDPILYYPGGDSTQAPLENVFPHHMTMLDSLRWDTVTPYILRLPKKYNTSSDTDYFYCYAYECWFASPVAVDSIYYVLGTYQSNATVLDGLLNYPTSYFSIRERSYLLCDPCAESDKPCVFSVDHFPNNPDLFWVQNDVINVIFGLFYPIIDLPSAKQRTGTRQPR